MTPPTYCLTCLGLGRVVVYETGRGASTSRRCADCGGTGKAPSIGAEGGA